MNRNPKYVEEAIKILDTDVIRLKKSLESSPNPKDKYKKLLYQAFHSDPKMRPNLKELLKGLEEYGTSLGLKLKSDEKSSQVTHLDKQTILEDYEEAIQIHPAFDKRSSEDIAERLKSEKPGTIALSKGSVDHRYTFSYVNSKSEVKTDIFSPTPIGYLSLNNNVLYPSIDALIGTYSEEGTELSILRK